ncbi:MAG: MFS transporter [Ignisphaera sp.]
MASFITPFISSAVNIALPSIARSLNIDMAQVNWFANAFLISLASTILLLGVIADYVGRERVFVSGVILFAITSAAIPYIKDFAALLILRCLQGLGAAMVSGTTVAILASMFRERTGLVIGINSAAVYIGTALGPVLGGFLTSFLGWPSIFIFVSFVALTSTALAFTSINLGKRDLGRRPDLVTPALFVASLAMVSTGSAYIKSFGGATIFGMGLTFFIATFIIEYKHPRVFARQIFEKRVFLAYLVALFNYVSTFALSILFSNYLQTEMGLSAWQAGLILLSQPIAQTLLSPIAGHLADRWDPGVLVALGMGLITLGIGASIYVYTQQWLLMTILVVVGIGFAFFASPNTTQIVRRVPKEVYATATAFLGTMRFLGQALSTSILTIVIATYKVAAPMKPALTAYLIASSIGTLLAVFTIAKEHVNTNCSKQF